MARVLAKVEGALMESRRFKGFGDERRREEKLARGSFYNANMRGDSN